MADQGASEPRHLQLDGLRCIAISAVIIQHAVPLGAYEGLLHPGMFGVQLFFVLSGFLITGILLDLRPERGGPAQSASVVARFYLRRALRIFPAYYLLCAVLLAAGLKAMVQSWPWQFAYLSDVYVVLNGGFPGALSHLWSLSVEEQFYLAWPWFMLLLPLRAVPVACAVALATGLASRLVVGVLGVPNGGILAICNLDTLAAGAWMAYSLREQPGHLLLRWLGSGRGLAMATLLVVATTVAQHGEGASGLAIFLGLNAAMILWLSALVLQADRGFPGLAGRVLAWRPLTWLGRISYGIYLYHGPMLPLVAIVVLPRLGLAGTGPWPVLCAVFATVVVAALSYHLFERPISDLKRFIPYRPSAPRVPSQAGRSARRALQHTPVDGT